MPSYLLSLLARQRVYRRDSFLKNHPHAWLVWEPGPWNEPPPESDLVKTRLPGAALARPGRRDPLCFELKLPPGVRSLRAGRSREADLIINDATVSREHLVFTLGADQGWSVTAVEQARPVTCRGSRLVPGDSVPLNSGDAILLGEVVVTFYDRAGFLRRLDDSP